MSEQVRVAYQGERGAFSEVAARRLLGSDVTAVPCHSFETMFASVTTGDSHCCVAPIENSLAGSIHRNYDLLLDSGLTIAGETNLRVVHNLIAPRGVELGDVRRVYSHPVALAQCTRFLAAHPEIEPVPVHDTAGAVRLVVEQGRDLRRARTGALDRGQRAELHALPPAPAGRRATAATARAGAAVEDIARVPHREQARRALPRPRRLRDLRHRPFQDRVAPDRGAAVGVRLLPRHRRPARGPDHRPSAREPRRDLGDGQAPRLVSDKVVKWCQVFPLSFLIWSSFKSCSK